MNTKYTVAVIGAGAAGQVMGRLLGRAGHEVVAIASRSKASAERTRSFLGQGEVCSSPVEAAGRASLVLITTPDDVIERVCSDMASRKGFRPGTLVVHCSGCYSSEILHSAHTCGARVGSIHPLRSLAAAAASVEGFPGTYCGYEGDPEAVDALAQIVRDIGGRGIRLKADGKALYHSAAVFASNYLVVLFDAALRLFQEAGIPRDLSMEALSSLSGGTLDHLRSRGTPAALTGPVERGDLATLQEHMHALPAVSPELRDVYALLGNRAVDLALAKGSISEEQGRAIRELFSSVESKS